MAMMKYSSASAQTTDTAKWNKLKSSTIEIDEEEEKKLKALAAKKK